MDSFLLKLFQMIRESSDELGKKDFCPNIRNFLIKGKKKRREVPVPWLEWEV